MSRDSTTSASTPGYTYAPAVDLRHVSELAERAAQAQMIEIDTTTLEDAGIPVAVPVLWDPKTATVHPLKRYLEDFRLKPGTKRGTARAQTLASFIALVDRHKTANSAIFADTSWRAPSFTAVIDYHQVEGTEPDNGKHRIAYQFPVSEEWSAWVDANGKTMTQGDFAAFLEDRIRELASPTDFEKSELERDYQTRIATPAVLMQLSRGMQVHVEARVKDVRNLQNGTAAIQFEETHRDADGKALEVPGLFLLQVAPFFQGEPVRVPVRLRYRLSGGKLSWHYQMVRPDLHVTERVRQDLDEVARSTALPCFEGSPEMSA